MTGDDPTCVDWAERDLVDLHARERSESLDEEGRIALAEVLCLLGVLVFVIVRQLWLV